MANSGLKEHFDKHHLNGTHGFNRKHNHVADFKNAKFKSATKIERVPGKYPGQIKIITKYPSKYLDIGWECYGEEGEAYFLLTGQFHAWCKIRRYR